MTDTIQNLRRDIALTIRSRGALRHSPLTRSHFWRRLEILRGRDPLRAVV